jgi:CheY-like chemotaxis protein
VDVRADGDGDGRQGTAVVALVEDDEWIRRGLADGLTELPCVAEVRAFDHGELRDRSPHWSEFQLVIVGSGWDPSSWDRYRGIEVARSIREAGLARPPVVVVRQRKRLHEVAQLRFFEVGAHAMWSRDDVLSHADLASALVQLPRLEPGAGSIYRQPAVRCLGVTSRTKIDAGLQYVIDHDLCGLIDGCGDGFFSRRQLITLRSKLSKLMGLDPIASGSGAVVNTTLPSWRQISTLLYLARGGEQTA